MNDFITKRKLIAFAFMLVMLAAIGCTGSRAAEVPPAHLGKLSEGSGLQEGVIQPSKIRLQTSPMCRKCPDLILTEASDYPKRESMTVFMPEDQLNLTVDVRGVYAVDEANIDQVFARIPASQTEDGRVKLITMERIYNTYAEQVIRESVRSFVTTKSILWLMNNRASAGAELTQIVTNELRATPIKPIQFGFADIQPPKIIVEANEKARQREIEIETAKAEKLVALEKAEAQREIALKQQEIDLIEADTQVQVQKILDESVSNAFLKQRSLKVLQGIADNPDGNTVWILPTEMIEGGSLDFALFADGAK